jgi:glycosyltransferase involved in cell wall biosynthesis
VWKAVGFHGWHCEDWSVCEFEAENLLTRRVAARLYSKGEFVLFMDDDNYAKPHEISTFVRAMTTSGADVLTSFVDFFWGEERPDLTSDRPSYMFLGGSADVGAFKNCFGDANCFVRRSSFDAIGGYTEDYGIGFEDWEMYANASLRGFKACARPNKALNHTTHPIRTRTTVPVVHRASDSTATASYSLNPHSESLKGYFWH